MKIAVDKYGYSTFLDESRTDPTVIAAIEAGTFDDGVGIAEIPDEATDWEVICEEYDRECYYEYVLYVLDGKLHRAYGTYAEIDEPEPEEED